MEPWAKLRGLEESTGNISKKITLRPFRRKQPEWASVFAHGRWFLPLKFQTWLRIFPLPFSDCVTWASYLSLERLYVNSGGG